MYQRLQFTKEGVTKNCQRVEVYRDEEENVCKDEKKNIDEEPRVDL
jgi:hypothetical protein